MPGGKPDNALGLGYDEIRSIKLAAALAGIAILLMAIPALIIAWALRRRKGRKTQPTIA
jgi:ABC-type molybdate transport system permease subunit